MRIRILCLVILFVLFLMACDDARPGVGLPTVTTPISARQIDTPTPADQPASSITNTRPEAEPPVETVILLEITPRTIDVGACARLRYQLENLGRGQLDGVPLPADAATGSLVICPEVSQSYTLSGIDDAGQTISQTVVLQVNASRGEAGNQTGSVPVSTTPGCLLALDILGTSSPDLCRFSPNGQRIAIPADDGALWVIGTQGEHIQQIVDPAGRFLIHGEVIWSPDGTYLAFSAVGLDGLGSGVGYYNFANGSIRYIGPDAEAGKNATATYPRWTNDGRLLITWYEAETEEAKLVSVFGPYTAAPDGPVPILPNTELELAAGYIAQQTFPWQPGRQWQVGAEPSYEVD